MDGDGLREQLPRMISEYIRENISRFPHEEQWDLGELFLQLFNPSEIERSAAHQAIQEIVSDQLGSSDYDPYWMVVKACLVELHGASEEQAEKIVAEDRQELKERGWSATQMALHEEPFYTANSLAMKAELTEHEVPMDSRYDELHDRILLEG